jgi:DNA-binding transcriptional LysR family regulator
VKINHYEYPSLKRFLVLTDILYFDRAGNSCNISISALSHSIDQLEDELGARLFVRDKRRVSMTA